MLLGSTSSDCELSVGPSTHTKTPSARAALCPCRSPPLPSACRHGQCQKRKQHPRRLLLLVAFSPTHLWVVMTRTATGQEAAAGATAAARRAHMPALRRAAKSCRSLWPGLGRWLRALGGGRATNKMIEPASYAARGRLPPERVIILLWLAAPTLPQWHVFSPATGLHANSFAAGSLCSPNPLQPLCPALLPSSFLCTNPYSFDASHKLAQMPSSPLHCSCL